MKKYPKESIAPVMDTRQPIFSGDPSVSMWDEINNARTVAELRRALYGVCCKLQQMESRVDHKEDRHRRKL
jgi:hypothetical protein